MKQLLTLVVLVAALSCGHRVAAQERPHIVYFLVDDLGFADVGFNGSQEVRTPNIDRLAQSGAVLDACYVQPVCSPTRAALLTGRYATHTGVYTVVRPGAPWGLPLAERTLPQALREAGYETALCGKWHLGEFQPDYLPRRRGFDHQYGHMFGMIDYFTHIRDGKHDWYRDDRPAHDEGYSTHLIAREACLRIEQKQADKPLFLYVPFNGVHAPHQVPEKYELAYPQLTGDRRAMAGMISAVDEAIGDIVQAIHRKGLARDTLMIFSSDNGGPQPGKVTMNTPLRAGKGTIYEGGVRVCACAAWPGKIPAGTHVREPLHAVDWYPTLLKLAGAPLEQKLPLDGRDIWPMLTQGAKSPHDAILLVGNAPTQAAIRQGDWKLLVQSGTPAARRRNRGQGRDAAVETIELYNLAEDIGESHNLAAAQPEKVRELRQRLDELLRDAVEPGDKTAPSALPGTPPSPRRD